VGALLFGAPRVGCMPTRIRMLSLDAPGKQAPFFISLFCLSFSSCLVSGLKTVFYFFRFFLKYEQIQNFRKIWNLEIIEI
jgi:hypothetical protein